MTNPLPVIVDLMPRDPSAEPPYTPAFLIALALSTCPTSWSGRIISEESIPVCHVLDTLKRGGWKLEPMKREDFK